MPSDTVVAQNLGNKEVVVVAGATTTKIKDSGIEIFYGSWVDGGRFRLELLGGDKNDGSTRDLFEATQGAGGEGLITTELPIDWGDGEVGCVNLDDGDVCGDNIGDNEERVLVVTGEEFKPKPSEWIDLPLEQVGKFRPQDINITSEIKNSYCPGESFTIRVEMEGLARIKNADNVTLVNQFNGEKTTVPMSEISTDPAQREASTSFSVNVPTEASPTEEFEMFTVKVGGGEKPITASIGSDSGDLSLEEISDISGVCAGDRLNPTVTARNAGPCEAEVGLEITNDVNDEVITVDSTSVGTGAQEPGSSEFFISGMNVPEVSSDTEEVQYDVDLTRDA